ncbi:MAG: cytochrome c oxidase subunit II [Hymenobacter sp.]
MYSAVVAASVVLLTVVGASHVFSSTYRHRDHDDQAEPIQTSSNLKLESVLVGIPVLLVVAFFFLSFNTTRAVLPPAGDTVPAVRITGHQWWWQASYPGTNVQTANEIHLPIGQRLLIEGTSADVIHDWWVPSFGEKMDVIPGLRNHVWATIKEPGIYEGACNEFCGQQHAWMRIRVVAHTPGRLCPLAEPPPPSPPPSPPTSWRRPARRFSRGPRAAAATRFGAPPPMVQQGPDLTHFGSRETMLAGLLPNNEANLANWLRQPAGAEARGAQCRGSFLRRMRFGRSRFICPVLSKDICLTPVLSERNAATRSRTTTYAARSSIVLGRLPLLRSRDRR